MNQYRSLKASPRARETTILVMRSTDGDYHPRSTALFDQLRRAVISIELNIVEGYALSTRPQFLRHLRIAIGSAAEAQCATELIGELGYMKSEVIDQLKRLLDEVLACLFGLVKWLGRRSPAPRSRHPAP
jgi:four helix bundle protein